MKRTMLQIVFSLMLVLGIGGVSMAIDPPHDYVNSCVMCHGSAAQYQPAYGSIDNTPMNLLCRSCHTLGGGATPKVTHSSTQSPSDAQVKYGDWTLDCISCHNPHTMEQESVYNWTTVGNNPSVFNGLYPIGPTLYTGTIVSAVSNTLTVSGSVTAMAINSLVGYQIAPNTAWQIYYRIAKNNGATITTEQPIKTKTATAGSTFAISKTNLMRYRVDRGKPITNSSGVVMDPNSRYGAVMWFNTSGPHSEVYVGTGVDDRTDPTTAAVCVICHTRTPVNNVGFAKFNASFDKPSVVNAAVVSSHANSDTATCWSNPDSCHKPPAQGFTRSAAACGDCHGSLMLDNSSLVKLIKVGTSFIAQTTGATNVGAHKKHEDTYTTGTCDYCHTGGMNPGISDLSGGSANSVGDYKIRMYFNVTSGGWKSTAGTYNGTKPISAGGTENNAFGYNGLSAGTVDSTNACANTYCHGGTLKTSGGTNYTPTWFSGPVGCGSCHGATAANPPTIGSHVKHVGNGGSALMSPQPCYTCHDATASLHANGQVEWSLNVTGTYKGLASGSVTNVPSSSYGSCLVYCHSNAKPLNDQALNVYNSVLWNSGAAQGCGSCHKKAGDTPNWSNAHTVHVNVYSASFNCNTCHSQVATSGSVINATNKAMHADGNKDVSINPNYGAGASYSAGTCTQVQCHSTGARLGGTMVNTPAIWNSTLSCTGCHKFSDTYTNMVSAVNGLTAAHNDHVSTDRYGGRGVNPINCYTCHKGTVTSAGNVISNFSNHVNGAKDVVFNNGTWIGNANWATPNCTTVYCHSNGYQASMQYYTPLSWSNAASGACGTCHGATRTAMPASPKHQTHINSPYYDFACSTCHFSVVGETNDSTVMPGISNFTLHVDGSRQVAYNAMASKTGTGSWNGTVCNTYCHSTGKNILTGNLPAAYNGSNFVNQVWSGSSMSCNSCHGRGQADGRPDYTSDGSGTAGANSHLFNSSPDSHGNVSCNSCHALTTTFANTLVNSTHVDGNIDVNFGYQVTAVWNSTNKTCTNFNCHGAANHSNSQWGAAGGCTSCHGQPPINAATMLNGAYASGRISLVANGVGKHSYHAVTKSYGCVYCHNGGQPSGGSHNSSPKYMNIGFNVSGNVNGVYNAPAMNFAIINGGSTVYTQTGSQRICSNIYCHSNGGNYNLASFVYQAADWDGSAFDTTYATGCNQCHGNATSKVTSTLHPVHSTTYGYNCATCHRGTVDNTGALVGNHVNMAKDVAFNAANTMSAGGTWTKPNCTTVYCHSGGNSASSFTPNTTPAWNNTLPTDCSGCHGGDASAATVMSTGVHASHINNATAVGKNISCEECHDATVLSNRTLTGVGNHVNMLVNVKFDNNINLNSDNPTYNGSIANGATGATKAPGIAVGSCAAVYCHSSGNLGTGALNIFQSVIWNATTGRTDCTSCHGNALGTKAHPLYANSGGGTANANSHVKHVDGQAYGCDFCHVTTTTSSTLPPTSVVVNGAHLNRVEDVSFKVWVGMTGVYNSTQKTCNSTYCHGATGPAWGGASMNCNSCHQSQGAGGTASITPAHNLHVNTTTGYYYSCAVCHDDTQVSHPGGTYNSTWHQGAEIAFENNGALWNTNQSYKGSTTATYRTGKITNNPYLNSVINPTYANGGAFTNDAINPGIQYTTNGTCSTIWCHSNASPVGGTNVYNTPNWSQSTSCTYCHSNGSEATSRTWSSSHDKHIKTYAGNGFTCNTCHAGTAASNTAIASGFGFANHVNGTKDVVFNSTYGGSYAASTYTCSTNYCHSYGDDLVAFTAPYTTATWNGTMPSDCTGCHEGNMSAASNMGTNAHNAHVSNPTGVGRLIGCAECHAATVSADRTISNIASHVNKLVNIKFDNAINLDSESPMYNGVSTTSGTGHAKTPGTAEANCQNVYCHSSGNLGAGAGNTFRTLVFNTSSPTTCVSCHGDQNTKSHPVYANTGPGVGNSNSHVKHVESALYGCEMCHAATVTDSTTLINGTKHLNRVEDVSFTLWGGATGVYNSTLKTCASTYCHGSNNPVWGDTSMNCGSCHQSMGSGGVATQAPAHNLHVNTTGGYYYSCSMCHDDAQTSHPGGIFNATWNQAAEVKFLVGAQTTWSVNQNYRGSATATYRERTVDYNPYSQAGSTPAYTNGGSFASDSTNAAVKYTTNGTCSTVWCHSNAYPLSGLNVYNTPSWNQTSSCNMCHSSGAEATSRTWSSKHDKHIKTYGANSNFTCNTCHAGTATNNTTITSGYGFANHVNGTKDVVFSYYVNVGSATTTYSSSSSQCANTYCHSEGNRATGFTSASIAWNGTPLTCDGCHGIRVVGNDVIGFGMPDYPNGTPKANTHEQHVFETGANCYNCHSKTLVSMSMSNVIGNFATHINKIYDIQAAGNFPGYGGNAVSFTVAVLGNATTPTQCSAVSCHQGSPGQWGANTPCQSCHALLAPDRENFAYLDGIKSIINAAEFNTTGHGTVGNMASGIPGAAFSNVGSGMCLYCHNDQVPHSASTNFFRLRDITNAVYGPNGACMYCHGVGSNGYNGRNGTRKVDATHYDTSGTGKHVAGTDNGGMYCWDCHDPHGDSNFFMIQNLPSKQSNTITFAPMAYANKPAVFTVNATGTDYANNTTYNGVCNVCHTTTKYYTDSSNSTHNSSQRCVDCHKHTTGNVNTAFGAAGGTSAGGADCSGCHADIYGRMHDGVAGAVYKHFMNSASASSYPLINQPSASDTGKTCLMCHVDHDVFNTKKASNLRKSANINTSMSSTGYTNSDYDSTTGGICMSCHFKQQFKTLVTNNGVQNVPAVPFINAGSVSNALAVASTSTHIFAVNSGAFGDGSKFRSVCTKCHNDTMDVGSGQKSSKNAQSVDPRFSTHEGARDTFFAEMGSSSPAIESYVNGKINTIVINTIGVGKTIYNSFAGYSLVLTSATTGQTQRKTIASSDSTSVTILNSEAWTWTPTTNDYFEITKRVTAPDEICFSCHSTAADGFKPTTGKDYYGEEPMDAELEAMYATTFADKGVLRDALAKNGQTIVICTASGWAANTMKGFRLETGTGRYFVTSNLVNTVGDTTCTGYGEAASVSINLKTKAIEALNAGTPYKLYKVTHPFDKDGRHDLDEGMAAPDSQTGAVSNSATWAVGDSGSCSNTASATTCTDAAAIWNSGGFVGLKINFTTGKCRGKSYAISANLVNSVTFATADSCDGYAGSAPAVGDNYYIGTRHVSCTDCHNPHSAQKSARNDGGQGTGITWSPGNTAPITGATWMKDANKVLAETGWAADRWKGYLLIVTADDGTLNTGFRQVRQITSSTTDSSGTTYNFGIPLTWIDSSLWKYEVTRLNGEAQGSSKGVWGVKVSGFSQPAIGTLQSPTSLTFTKVYDVAANSAGMQYEICLKCHSYYAYGTAFPTTPSGGPNNTMAQSTDVAIEFNTNNLAHHAVFSIGKNQPVPSDGTALNTKSTGRQSEFPAFASALNANWGIMSGMTTVASSNGWVTLSSGTLVNTVLPGWYAGTAANNFYQIVYVNTTTSFRIAQTNGNPWDTAPLTNSALYPTGVTITQVTPGLGDAFVPPYGPWAIIRCTDCHGSKLSDPVGPHASSNKWLLRDGENKLKFQWYKGGVYNTVVYGTGTGAASNSFTTAYICYNCHRADVYGTPTSSNTSGGANMKMLARVRHGNGQMYSGSCTTIVSGQEGRQGIFCKACHGGDKLGGIHGSNKMNANTGTGSTSNKQAKRFLNGGTWGGPSGGVGQMRPTAASGTGGCYVNTANSDVNACTQGHSGTGTWGGGVAAYNYDNP